MSTFTSLSKPRSINVSFVRRYDIYKFHKLLIHSVSYNANKSYSNVTSHSISGMNDDSSSSSTRALVIMFPTRDSLKLISHET
jgi:hypothetical protein